MSDTTELTQALRSGRQADMDGVMVIVSRSACEEGADLIETQAAEIARLRAALHECQEEIDQHTRQEYPGVHPVHERYRQRGFAANPARIALESTHD